MPAVEEYAQLAGRVYNRTTTNRVPLLKDWIEVNWYLDNFFGFSAGVYRKGSEVVISYTGTNEAQFIDFVTANAQLAGGLPTPQLSDAVRLYEQVKAANPGANITLTGHSLGAGLASLIATYFNRPAMIFDPAPFALSAISPLSLAQVSGTLSAMGVVDPDFDTYRNLLYNGGLNDEYQRRTRAIQGRYLVNEVLQFLRGALPTAVGALIPIPTGSTKLGAIDLHSIVLLSSFLNSESFTTVSRQMPGLLPAIFDKQLFATDPQASDKINLLDLMYQHQLGKPGLTPDGMLDRFGVDFQKLADLNLVPLDETLLNGVIAIGLQHYYQQETTQASIFTAMPGGIQFDLTNPLGDRDTALGDILGYQKLLPEIFARADRTIYTDTFENATDAIRPFIQEKRRWSINLGSNGITGQASEDTSDFVFGGAGADTFDAGGGDDLLFGGLGNDTLSGGAGDDKLFGSDGIDTLDGGAGDDRLSGGRDADILKGGDDKDLLVGGDGSDTLLDGGDGNDEIYGDGKAEDDKSFAGNDLLIGGKGNDKLFGGAGIDQQIGRAHV